MPLPPARASRRRSLASTKAAHRSAYAKANAWTGDGSKRLSTIVFVGWSQAPRSSFVIIIVETRPWAVLSGISNVAHSLSRDNASYASALANKYVLSASALIFSRTMALTFSASPVPGMRSQTSSSTTSRAHSLQSPSANAFAAADFSTSKDKDGNLDNGWAEIDDMVAFLRLVVAEASDMIDAKKVHMAGFSQGAFVAWNALCRASDLICSIAPTGFNAYGEYDQGIFKALGLKQVTHS